MSEGVYLDLDRVHELVLEVKRLRARHINWQPIENDSDTPKSGKTVLVGWSATGKFAGREPEKAYRHSQGQWLGVEGVIPQPTHWCELEGPE